MSYEARFRNKETAIDIYNCLRVHYRRFGTPEQVVQVKIRGSSVHVGDGDMYSQLERMAIDKKYRIL